MTNTFIDAIIAKDFNTAGLLVWQACKTDATLQECIDWVTEGAYDGTETATSVAAELDGLNTLVEGVDY